MLTWQVYLGSALDVLKALPDCCVQCIVTSPPYYALRDYGVPDQLGLEPTPAEYVDALCGVMAEARRLLTDDGALWLNIGDSYAGVGAQTGGTNSKEHGRRSDRMFTGSYRSVPDGCKQKDLLGIPWMVAFALRADGWYLRCDVIWAKPNPMPESVQDRPTKAHEYVFLLTKSAKYWYDPDAIREKYSASTLQQIERGYDGEATKDYESAGAQNPSETKARIIAGARRDKQRGHGRRHAGFNDRWDSMPKTEQTMHGANARSVWTIATEPSSVEHFAVMPRQLARRCIVSGCKSGGTVLDPFAGAGTTGVVALEEGRNFIGVELNPKYREIARQRLAAVAPLLAQEVAS